MLKRLSAFCAALIIFFSTAAAAYANDNTELLGSTAPIVKNEQFELTEGSPFAVANRAFQPADISNFTTAIKNFEITGISVSAEAAVLYEPTEKRFLYTKNADKRLPMASTTKIMTALIAVENASLADIVTIDERAYGIEGSSAYLKLGSEYTLEEMLYALLLQSANDAAIAIAYTVGGDVSGFVEMMNEKCAELGLSDTHFDNPNGLDSDTHYTTARELAIISACAMENEVISKIVGTYKMNIGEGENARLFVNHNKLLRMLDGCNGIKTGFTKKCGRCLVASCERDGLSFITVTLDAPNDWTDHKAMLERGYENLKCLTLAARGEFSYDIPIISAGADKIRAENTEELKIIVKADFPEVKEYIKLSPFTTAPIKAGDVLGSVIFEAEGAIVGSVDIKAMYDAPALSEKRTVFDRIKDIFKKG